MEEWRGTVRRLDKGDLKENWDYGKCVFRRQARNHKNGVPILGIPGPTQEGFSVESPNYMKKSILLHSDIIKNITFREYTHCYLQSLE
jgi:hypothetical protein